MQQSGQFWTWYGLPVVLSLTIFGAFNAFWNRTTLGAALNLHYPYTLGVYLVGGSGLALGLLWRAGRAGRLNLSDFALGPSGWTPPRRLGALAVIAMLVIGSLVHIDTLPESKDGPSSHWAEYCFWFLALLSASQAELLVFFAVGYGMTQRGLREHGVPRLLAFASGALVTCVGFGLFHWTHEPRWHAYSVFLMVEMLLVLVFALATANFYLTLVLHNAFATLGFVTEQHSAEPQELAAFIDPFAFDMNLAAFLIPFILLHLLEWKGFPKGNINPGQKGTG